MTADGVSLLDDAPGAFVCATNEVIERRTHALLGRVRLAHGAALLALGL
jgi:hypothetical protein